MGEPVKIGCVPRQLNLIEVSECFQNYCSNVTEAYPMPKVIATCTNLGLWPELTTIILQIAGIPLESQLLVPSDSTSYGSKINGVWNGVIGRIKDGTVDVSLPLFTDTEERREVADFSYPVLQTKIAFLTRSDLEGNIFLVGGGGGTKFWVFRNPKTIPRFCPFCNH